MKIKYLHLLILFFLLNACIDPYEVDFNGKNRILVVEGILTDDTINPDTIKIQYSKYDQGFTRILPIESSVLASILVLGTGQEIKLIQYNNGKFLPPPSFKINLGEKYVLKFTLPDGQQFESTAESLTLTPPILKIYDKFNLQSSLSEDGIDFLSANEVFVDFQDTPNQKNYYLWRYRHYEKLRYCQTCSFSYYDLGTSSCIMIPQFLRYNYYTSDYYDYICQGECYGIFKGKLVNVFSDILSEGALVSGRRVAKIPYYNDSGCLVEIQQMCVSQEAYVFYKLLEAQGESTGSLADTPPAAIVGNIKNITNPAEKVVGYFGIANIQRKRLWIDRKDAAGKRESILGHVAVEEPLILPRPPSIICTKTLFRTPIKPDGWQ
jgi:Domain of unknown function (DUF4249)